MDMFGVAVMLGFFIFLLCVFIFDELQSKKRYKDTLTQARKDLTVLAMNLEEDRDIWFDSKNKQRINSYITKITTIEKQIYESLIGDE